MTRLSPAAAMETGFGAGNGGTWLEHFRPSTFFACAGMDATLSLIWGTISATDHRGDPRSIRSRWVAYPAHHPDTLVRGTI